MTTACNAGPKDFLPWGGDVLPSKHSESGEDPEEYNTGEARLSVCFSAVTRNNRHIRKTSW